MPTALQAREGKSYRRISRDGPGGWIILVDPLHKPRDVSKLQSGRWVILETYAEHDPVQAESFQEVAFELSHLWLAESS